MDHYENLDLDSIVTPVKVEVLGRLLNEANYDQNETAFLIYGFTNGFDIGYHGPKVRKSTSRNIPFTPGVGDKYEKK